MPILHSGLETDLRLAVALDQGMSNILASTFGIRTSGAVVNYGSVNGTGSDTKRVRLVGLGGTDQFATTAAEDTDIAETALTDASAGAILHGGDVTPDTKHGNRFSAFTAAATVAPATIWLVDLLGFYPITTVTTTGDQAMDNTVTLPRYTDGAGVQAFLVPTTIMGAGTPNIRLTYTDSDGNAGNLTPGTLPIGKTASNIGHICYSGTGAGKYNPFIPLAAGDKGIRSVQQFNLSATYTSGALSLVLCRPICDVPLITLGVAGERDLTIASPSWPRIYDGACLGLIMIAGAATPVSSSYSGVLDVAWGDL